MRSLLGIAAWHGPHQVAETSTITILPAKSASRVGVPFLSSTVNFGATSPVCSRGATLGAGAGAGVGVGGGVCAGASATANTRGTNGRERAVGSIGGTDIEVRRTGDV